MFSKTVLQNGLSRKKYFFRSQKKIPELSSGIFLRKKLDFRKVKFSDQFFARNHEIRLADFQDERYGHYGARKEATVILFLRLGLPRPPPPEMPESLKKKLAAAQH